MLTLLFPSASYMPNTYTHHQPEDMTKTMTWFAAVVAELFANTKKTMTVAVVASVVELFVNRTKTMTACVLEVIRYAE